jgi:NADH:ubiquinone oxidoreductase subunit F (NADH-binding)/NADH:ubiquinone oxidoreductase subunit E
MRAQPYRQERKDPAVQTVVEQLSHGVNANYDLLPILTEVQHANHGVLDRTRLGAIADEIKTNDGHVFGVASFYSMLSTHTRPPMTLRICDGPICRHHASEELLQAIREKAREMGEWGVESCSCLGLCDRAPAALREEEPCGPISPDQAGDLLAGRFCGQAPSYAIPIPGEVRVCMERVGRVDPDSIDSAVEQGAYRALGLAIHESPFKVLETVEASGLRGRGGAGYPAGRKWRMVVEAKASQKYVVCNADESEPGTFKDRVLMEHDPHLLLEGLALAAFAVGADQGFIYVRGEFEWIAKRLERAIRQCEEQGWLGPNIQGSEFSLKLQLHRGAGAYICGEETALIESLEGKRGQPRSRPPYPTTHGYLGRPTLVNNVETICQVPAIMNRGPGWFKSLGPPNSPGTKVFTLTGHVCRPGAFETPLGLSLRQIIDQFGGGMRPNSRFKAALTGGAAGTFVPASMLDVPIDFESAKQGIALGSGAILILDESVPIPRALTWLLRFFEEESCGKCTPCREGSREIRLLCEQFTPASRVASVPGALNPSELDRLAQMIKRTSLCGLGQSIAWPVTSALKHFGHEFR